MTVDAAGTAAPMPTRREMRPHPKSSKTAAIIAIAAGAVLLVGGGGTTLAYWSTQQTVPAGVVQSGDLDLSVSTDDAVWTLTPEGGTAAPVADIAALAIVPGDTVTMTQTATLTLVGTDLTAELTAALTGAVLPAGVTAPTPTVTLDGADAAALTEADDGAVATVTLSYTFPSSTSQRDLTDSTFDFGDVSLTLTQTTD